MMKPMRKWREDWRYPTSLLCIYGFFTTVRPIDPFLVSYLTGPEKNLTEEQVNNVIYPMSTYGNLCAQVPVFLLTDWLRHKPVAILECLALFVTTALTCWATTVSQFQVSEFFFGMSSACKVAYYSYIYSMVDVKKYRKATSFIRSIQLLGHTVGSVLGQLIFSLRFMSFYATSIMILTFIGIALVTSFMLPMPEWSMFFHRKTKVADLEFPGEVNADHVKQKAKIEAEGEKSADEAEDPQESAEPQTCGKVLLQMIRDSRDCFRSRRLLYWSLWWVMATCGFNQSTGYAQALWKHLQPSQNTSVYNGVVEAVAGLLSAATVYAVGFKEEKWGQWEELALGGFSGLCTAALFTMTFSGNIWVGYVVYIIFKCLYMVLMTLAMFHIATDLTMERYALVFGVNNFVALVLQTIFTSVVVNKAGLGLTVIPQYTVYSCYFLVISAIFVFRGLYVIWSRKKNQKLAPPVKNEPLVCAEHKF